jgi:nonribosomal peptide synthetase DhbF
LSAQYADVAAWMAERDLAAQESFWGKELAGLPSALELPFDRSRRRSEGARPAGQAPITIDPALAARLHDLAQEEGASLFMLLQAALATLLMRYGAGTDIPIAAPVANRHSVEAEKLIGFFVNTLVLRTRLEGQPSFRELLARVRASVLASLEHQELPFERVVEILRPGRVSTETPLAQVMLVLGPDETGALPLPGVRTRLNTLPPQHAKFDLVLLLDETAEGGLAGRLEYDGSRFLPETAAQLTRHLVSLLRAAAAMPDEPVTRLRFLDPSERRALVAEAGVGEGPDTTLTMLLEEQAAATPGATAIVAADRTTLSFAALHAAAGRVAARLAARGIGRGARVAVVCPRTPDLVVAILGVLKSGAAYVPIDPAYPTDRIAGIGRRACGGGACSPGADPARCRR